MNHARRAVLRVLVAAGIATGLAACSASSEQGTSVRLVSSGSALSGQEMSSSAGGRLRVDELLWTVSEIQLRECRSAWQRAADWVIPTAHAHGLSTPTLLAVPTVESASTDTDSVLGQMSPPAGRYCGVRYRLGPADADAEGLGATEMLGRSLLLRGASGDAGGPLEAFEVESRSDLDIELSVELELSADHPSLTLRFTHDTSLLLQSLDLGSADADDREQALFEAFRAALGVHAE